jgi:uncharacterized membrane protein
MKIHSLRHAVYELRGGYIVLPVLITGGLSLVALFLPGIEIDNASVAKWAHHTRWLVPGDAAMSQLVLAAIAGSCITVVSVVYSVLLIALTFASIQFSPRILMSFVKDRVSQGTLGAFIGTFAYCILLLPHIDAGRPIPTLSMTVALFFAGICLCYLIFFIHHIAIAIQANYIVDRIARDTEELLKERFGAPLVGFPESEEPLVVPTGGVTLRAAKSGYIQYIDEDKLLALAKAAGASIYYHRGVGQFIAASVPLANINPDTAANEEFQRQCQTCFHIGPLRSMEEDVEFGVLQIVDIALKAISPAVNDPSTAISCIDHLSSIMVLAASLTPPVSRVYDDKGVVRLIRRQPSFVRLLEVAYNQIGPYGKGDMAVTLRLMRALYDISGATKYPPYLAAICKEAERVGKACASCFPEDDCHELFDRMAAIESRQLSTADRA